MKKQAFGIIAALFALTLALVAGAYATDAETAGLSAADVYAILYEDGELVFQYGDATDGRAVTKAYPLDLSATYTNQSPAPWYNERESVRVVSFADKVSPTSTACWFWDCSNLEHIDNIQNLDTANVTNMRRMFYNCSGLTTLDVSHFDTSNVVYMTQLFDGCRGLTTLDVSHFDTSNVKFMMNMFLHCSRLTSLDMSHFDTSNVNNMAQMFYGCSRLKTLDLSSFNTAKVRDMTSIFSYCSNLNAIYVSDKFTIAFIEEISEWQGSQNMFRECNALVGGNGTTYDESHTNKEYARIDAPDAPGYFTYKAAPVAYAITSVKMENGKLSVTLTNPAPATLAVAYFDANGKFVTVTLRNVQANAGTLALDLLTGAATLRVMLLDSDFRPVGRL